MPQPPPALDLSAAFEMYGDSKSTKAESSIFVRANNKGSGVSRFLSAVLRLAGVLGRGLGVWGGKKLLSPPKWVASK
eukprot:202272-Prorocentrum_minimum.AAC.2